MVILRDDNFIRHKRNDGTGRGRLHGASLFVLMFISVALLVLSKLNHGLVHETRKQIAEVAAPALETAMVPVQPLRRLAAQLSAQYKMSEELRRLREENRKLKDWQWRAKELDRRLTRLGRLARVVKEPALEFVTGRVIADAGGPFVRIALMNAGAANGIRDGFPVINGDGLVGRVVDTGRLASRLLLLTDLNSRVPVMVGPLGHRALLLGDNGPVPKLGYLPDGAAAEPGDEVYTSGVGGLFPRGLKIGTVKRAGRLLRVALHARLGELEYVSVLFFDMPTLEPSGSDRKELDRRLARRLGRSGRIGGGGALQK